MSAPVAVQWTGEAFVPVGRFAAECDKHFVVGERYVMVEHEHRSRETHAHYFACINEAWANLPERYAGRFPTPEHLRKWALIRAGYRDETTFVASSKAEARRIVTFMRPADEFAVVVATDAVVTRYTAKSQSMRAMDREAFQASKTAVLAVLASMVEVAPNVLEQQARAA